MTTTTVLAPTSLDFVHRLVHTGDAAVGLRPALATRAAGVWTERTYADLDRSTRRVAAWLAAEGVAPGDRVALVGEPGAPWVIGLLGAWRRGAVVVPLDAKLTAAEVAPIVERARPAAVLAAGTSRPLLGAVCDRLPVLSFDDLAGHGEDNGSDADCARGGDEAALVVWTSGTSGAPKGVTLSFANVAYVVDAGCTAHRLDGTERWLSILPLNHMLEISCGLLPALATGATFAFAGTVAPSEVVAAMAERRFDRMTVVPLFLTALLRGIDERTQAHPVAFRIASALARAVPSAAVRRRLFAPVHRSLGDGHPSFQCGGAALDPAVSRRFELFGIPVYGGYGLTETAPTVAMDAPTCRREGSVGRPLPGTEVRIAADGEILVRSPGVMLGYWEDEALTAAAIDADGWFRTGDLGRLDEDGFLYVTGRAKSLIVLTSGRKVQPEEVEASLDGSEWFAESCVVGWAPPTGRRAGSEQVCAVVVPSAALLARCPTRLSLEEAAKVEVARRTAGLASFKRPAVVRVLGGDLPRTPKRSVRRAEVVRLLDR